MAKARYTHLQTGTRWNPEKKRTETFTVDHDYVHGGSLETGERVRNYLKQRVANGQPTRPLTVPQLRALRKNARRVSAKLGVWNG